LFFSFLWAAMGASSHGLCSFSGWTKVFLSNQPVIYLKRPLAGRQALSCKPGFACDPAIDEEKQ
jgi:hypothetical protein